MINDAEQPGQNTQPQLFIFSRDQFPLSRSLAPSFYRIYRYRSISSTFLSSTQTFRKAEAAHRGTFYCCLSELRRRTKDAG